MESCHHINVFIVDDHQIVRDGVKALLKNVEGIKIVNEASNGQEAIDLIRQNPKDIDVVIMDITMPEMDGVQATKLILKEFPKINILALSMHDDKLHLISMLKEGAMGYVLKTTGKSELVHAINRIAGGQSYFDRQASGKLLDYLSNKDKRKKTAEGELTSREKEVLMLIAEEMTNAEIAEKLFLSPRTIDTHRRNLLQKLNVKNTAGLVKYALTHEL
ncbi:response regulator transcription factor [Fulvivirga sp.]|uniref:response regulator transcription factor n=1 Tax=Fulvivirga sp. TaxID=1931237 RepID=UPI0032EBF263